MVEGTSLLRTVHFKDLEKWNVNIYVNSHNISFKYNAIKLEQIIIPRKERIKNKEYNGQYSIVEKIRFNDGRIFLRSEKNPKTDLNVSCKNDLLVSNINFEKGAFSLNSFGTIVTSTDYQSYKIIYPIDYDFFFYTLRCEVFLNLVKSLKSGGMKTRARYDFIKQFKIPVPPLEEQKTIIQKYNDAIADAERLEKKANEVENSSKSYFDKKLEIIEFSPNPSNGLNFINFSLIDLWGVDKNLCRKTIRNKKYEVRSVESLCSVGSGGTPNRANKDYYENGTIPWVKTTEVVDSCITDTEEKITEKGYENSSAKIYEPNSLIIAMYGQGKTRGRTAKLNIAASTNQACAVLYDINTDIISVDYLWYYFQNEYERIRELASGNNQPNLNAGMIKSYPVVIPPLSVQEEIVSHINEIKANVKSLRKQAADLRTKAKQDFENAVFN